MHNLNVEATAGLRFFEDLVDHADRDREFVHVFPYDEADSKETEPLHRADLEIALEVRSDRYYQSHHNQTKCAQD
jgi:hypothetical protein